MGVGCVYNICTLGIGLGIGLDTENQKRTISGLFSLARLVPIDILCAKRRLGIKEEVEALAGKLLLPLIRGDFKDDSVMKIFSLPLRRNCNGFSGLGVELDGDRNCR